MLHGGLNPRLGSQGQALCRWGIKVTASSARLKISMSADVKVTLTMRGEGGKGIEEKALRAMQNVIHFECNRSTFPMAKTVQNIKSNNNDDMHINKIRSEIQ
ncbi:hypothetical protein PoB_006758500 [Plakobranchus ocellatus]|uniref:Uncharacterized protein n=1 Tax=Plakobranchus ocellatus TaxID=259542 RepID=A0AAV4DAG4_9GAST|nr:hypothetical protein PoB_006758500 [Plakobranchus ocellatus]